MTLEDWIRGSKVRDFQSIEEKMKIFFRRPMRSNEPTNNQHLKRKQYNFEIL